MASGSCSRGGNEAKEHIGKIRRDRFYIGRDEENPLAEDIHQAVSYLSEELYAKDVHFLMELIQNAEDNEYPPDVVPSLEFVITSEDITATGAANTLLVFNNEKGFSPKNVESICRVGKSTKKGSRHKGYIGEKGIGFKSVFIVTSHPYIFSGGYQIRFNEKPVPECPIGYIVPEWVGENPSLNDIQRVYGTSGYLPTTVIILPLKTEKVESVKKQLSNMHPEILLFLTKIKKLSVRETCTDPRLNTVKAVCISSETNFQTRKSIDAESYTIHLASEEDGINEEEECSYYMWRQKFPVKPECRVEKRMEVEEWVITLSFPHGKRLDRGLGSPGLYAFLPTEMQTGFPFIIQADFILASSRETILLENKWNKGILDCVTAVFVNALTSLVKSTETAPLSSLPRMFHFLPVSCSTFPIFNQVRLCIKEKLAGEYIIPCESYTNQRIFSKADNVRRLMPAFWDILTNARDQGIILQSLSSHGTNILTSAFDKASYNEILKFLGIGYVDKEWYAKCIESSNLAKEISEQLYCDLLYFLANNWRDFQNTMIKTIPLLKCIDINGKVSMWSIHTATKYGDHLCLSLNPNDTKWLINWNREFECAAGLFFFPEGTRTALDVYSKTSVVTSWLEDYVEVKVLSVYDYSVAVMNAVKNNKKHLLAFTHFLYHSLVEKCMEEWEIVKLCESLPVVDNYGRVTSDKRAVLVPANCSKWVELMGSNPWREEKYIELGVDYIKAGCFAGTRTPQNKLLEFLVSYIKASDVPHIRPPNATFPTVASTLTKENTFMLLEWIRQLNRKENGLPPKFLQCIRTGGWLRTSVGNKSPEESFLSSSEWGSLLQEGSVLVDIPLIDQRFYDDRISSYKEELKTLGVMSEFKEACQFIGKRLMTMVSGSTLTRTNVFSILHFMRFLRDNCLQCKDFVESVAKGNWLKTSHGYKHPAGSILFDSEWESASSISNLPFIDTAYYGEDIKKYYDELQLLGVIVDFNKNYNLVVTNFLPSKQLSSATADAIILILDCIRHACPTEQLINAIKHQKWLRTNHGLKSPADSCLLDPDWECLLQVAVSLPVIDEKFYGSRIHSYKEELKKLCVSVGYDEVSKVTARELKKIISSSSFGNENVLQFLSCQRSLKQKEKTLHIDLRHCLQKEKWLPTLLGSRTPGDSILNGPEWSSISPIVSLPFIDDSLEVNGKQIRDYKDELKDLGVVVNFEKGLNFIATGIKIPNDPSEISPTCFFSLMKCIQDLQTQRPGFLDNAFSEKFNKKWLKTTMGFKYPKKCILFDSKSWGACLDKEDIPALDESFYGCGIRKYNDVLKCIGVVTDHSSGGKLVADHLKYHTNFLAISRIYEYLSDCNWKPEDGADKWIWIPNENDSGVWVSPESCVIHDKNDLFTSIFHVLDNYYQSRLLGFFAEALGVKRKPKLEDYCEVWNEWENNRPQLSESECCAFWVFVAKEWCGKSKDLLSSLRKLPVNSPSGIILADKEDVFIPDDLLLKDIIEHASQGSIFVWHPLQTMAFLSKTELYDIYSKLGVLTISEALTPTKPSVSDANGTKKGKKDQLLKVGLFKIVLAVLADPSFDMTVEKRHQVVKSLADVTVFETDECIEMGYSLSLSSGKILNIAASRAFYWNRDTAEFFVQKVKSPNCHKNNIEFSTYFAEVISEGLLWDKADKIAELAEVIKFGCLLEFDSDAVEFLLKSKNLQLLYEDEEFLRSDFSHGNAPQEMKSAAHESDVQRDSGLPE